MASTALILAAASAPASADEPEKTKILFLLDVSGSMNEKVSSGGTKLAAAKQAVKSVAGSLPDNAEVGLRVYGSKISEPKEKNPKACRDTDLVLPVGPLDRGKLDTAVGSFKAVGETPIAYSLTKSIGDLGSSGKRVLVLVSDGEENCVKDPCPTAKKLAGSGVDLQFNAVGFDVNAKARKQLKCIAGAGNGSYYDADRSGDLTDSLQKITTRALRPFQLSGTPVKGTDDPSSAPAIADGQYTDRFAKSVQERYYRIDRQPGHPVSVSLADVNHAAGGYRMTSYNLELQTADGQTCDSARGGSTSLGSAKVATTVVGAPATGSAASSSGTDDPCVAEPLVLKVQPSQFVEQQPVLRIELRVSSTPPATNVTELPEPAGPAGTARTVKAAKPVRHVVGGTSFVDAGSLQAGTWDDTIAVGETLMYRVPVKYGQRLRVTADLPKRGTDWSPGDTDGFYPGLTLFGPDRAELTSKEVSVTGAGGGDARLSAVTTQVRYRNRESADRSVRWTSQAGDYYIGVSLGALQPELTGRLMHIRLSVAVDGAESGVPQLTAASASASPSAGSTPSTSSTSAGTAATDATPGSNAGDPADTGDGNTGNDHTGLVVGVVVGGLVLAAACVGGGILIGRSRRRS
ncbi:VWA domain-containing protein [Microlunatus elymi]|uniref:VWA domain-containing protein n=1 Tax=Microlunatus elymi TaxID=2596828 RepID=A0A516PZK4_9ACTN|nr:VWA domain-containing protein [Microlunatus elymi]QDP96613.1 VWA domain-containing protein [Microlunatus elymi]